MVVYILFSKKSDGYYIGQTEDLPLRLIQHLHKLLPVAYTKAADDWIVYYSLECSSRKQAVNIERHIKRMKSRRYIQNLVTYPELGEKLKMKYQ